MTVHTLFFFCGHLYKNKYITRVSAKNFELRNCGQI